MIQRILLILLLFVSTTALAETKPYPDKWDKFDTFDDLKDVYLKIARDTNNEDESEILERLSWHEIAIGNDAFTEAERSAYKTFQIPELSIKKYPTWFDQGIVAGTLQKRYNYEKGLLRLENDIDFQNWAETVFVNASMADSPFDLIEDLHNVERVLFGKKFEEQKFDQPLFSIFDEDQKQLLLESENWQDGREETMQALLGSRQYEERDISLTGSLEGLRESFNALLYMSLLQKEATKQDKQSSTSSQTSNDTYGAGISLQETSAPDNVSPESETVLREKSWKEINGLIAMILKKMGFFARFDQESEILTTAISKGEKMDEISQESIDKQLESWENTGALNEINTFHRILQNRLDLWNQDVSATLKGFITLKKILEDFLNEKEAG